MAGTETNPPYHVYDLDADGHEASRATTDTLCTIRDVLSRSDNPVTDVIILAATRTCTADKMFSEMENQRPAGLNVCYTLVTWPSFVPADINANIRITNTNTGHTGNIDISRLTDGMREPTSGDALSRTLSGTGTLSASLSADKKMKVPFIHDVHDDDDTDSDSDDAEGRFERLFRNLEKSCTRIAEGEALKTLKLKCVSYMMDVQRLVDYGKIPNTCLSDDLKESILNLVTSISGDTTTVLFEELDSLNIAVSRAIGYELGRIRQKLSRASTESNITNIQSKVGTQKNWLMLCFLIGTVVHRAFEKRAWYIGRNWVHPFIADLMRHARPNIRFHLVGAGPGAQLSLSALTVPANIFSRKLHSATFTEGTFEVPCTNFGGSSGKLKSIPGVAGPVLATVTPGKQITILRGYDTLEDYKSVGRCGMKGVLKKQVRKIDLRSSNTSKVPLRILAGHYYDLLVDPYGQDIAGGASCNPTIVALFWKVALIKIARVNYQIKDNIHTNHGNGNMSNNNGNNRSQRMRRTFTWRHH